MSFLGSRWCGPGQHSAVPASGDRGDRAGRRRGHRRAARSPRRSAQRSGQDNLVNASDSKQLTATSVSRAEAAAPPAALLRVVSVTPAGGAHHANGGAPVTLTFSSALSPRRRCRRSRRRSPGSWKVTGATATFTPSSGFLPDTKVTREDPRRHGGMRSGRLGGHAQDRRQASRSPPALTPRSGCSRCLRSSATCRSTWTPDATATDAATGRLPAEPERAGVGRLRAAGRHVHASSPATRAS